MRHLKAEEKKKVANRVHLIGVKTRRKKKHKKYIEEKYGEIGKQCVYFV